MEVLFLDILLHRHISSLSKNFPQIFCEFFFFSLTIAIPKDDFFYLMHTQIVDLVLISLSKKFSQIFCDFFFSYLTIAIPKDDFFYLMHTKIVDLVLISIFTVFASTPFLSQNKMEQKILPIWLFPTYALPLSVFFFSSSSYPSPFSSQARTAGSERCELRESEAKKVNL